MIMVACLLGAAVGVDSTSRERVAALVHAGCDVITVDTAHGHSLNVMKMVDFVSQEFPHVILVAGNVVTAEGTTDLIKRGVDVVKVGVGPGSICTTRVVSGRWDAPNFGNI
jgi:IMP dehydrogenase